MLKLIVGTKGSGKTKTMIDMIDKATKNHFRQYRCHRGSA